MNENELMRAKDLMIGDWVRRINIKEPCNVKVTIIHEHDCIFADNMHGDQNIYLNGLEYDPIPLTEEILNKNFEYYNYGHNNYGWNINDYSIVLEKHYEQDYFDIGLVVDDRESYYLRPFAQIKYVHELQHALKFCNINKNIVL